MMNLLDQASYAIVRGIAFVSIVIVLFRIAQLIVLQEKVRSLDKKKKRLHMFAEDTDDLDQLRNQLTSSGDKAFASLSTAFLAALACFALFYLFWQ